MRVVAGHLGGRTFEAPRSHRTHPMGDKVRGALFNTLGDIEGLTVLDAFAGSGAMSIEAISRGASSAVAIDVDKDAYATIVNNLALLKISDRVTVQRTNARSWSNSHRDLQFDVVLLDPPYDAVNYAVLQKLGRHAKPGGITVLSLPPDHEFTLQDHELLARKQYGDAELDIYRRLPE
jgi:16S rRNA (guanine966-N2)-methyltransferase